MCLKVLLLNDQSLQKQDVIKQIYFLIKCVFKPNATKLLYFLMPFSEMKAMKTVNKVSVPNPTALLNSVATTAGAASFLKHTVDHRPTRLLVSGYETDEQDSVLTHFKVC